MLQLETRTQKRLVRRCMLFPYKCGTTSSEVQRSHRIRMDPEHKVLTWVEPQAMKGRTASCRTRGQSNAWVIVRESSIQKFPNRSISRQLSPSHWHRDRRRGRRGLHSRRFLRRCSFIRSGRPLFRHASEPRR